jgi:hypothetical protein
MLFGRRVFVICPASGAATAGPLENVGLNNLLISNFDTRMLDDGGFWAPNNVNAVTSLPGLLADA